MARIGQQGQGVGAETEDHLGDDKQAVQGRRQQEAPAEIGRRMMMMPMAMIVPMGVIVVMAVMPVPVIIFAPVIMVVGIIMVMRVVMAMGVRVRPAVRFGMVVVVIGAGRVIMIVIMVMPVIVLMILMIMVVLMRGIVGHGCTAKRNSDFPLDGFAPTGQFLRKYI